MTQQLQTKGGKTGTQTWK